MPERMSAAQLITEKVRQLAKAEDVPVLGIGSCTAMENEPAGYRPSDLLPGARSMICFGLPIPRSVYEKSPYTTEMVWRTQNLLYRRLDTLSLALAQKAEEHGAGAVPVFGCCPMAVNQRGRVVGYVNQLRMAELAGIGRIGRNGLLLHGPYGARLMLGAVLTTLELPVLRVPDVEHADCPAGCRICIDSCPVKAIVHRTRWVNIMRCLGYAARTPFMSKLRFALLSKVRPAAAARLMNLRAFDEHTMHICSSCVAVCPYGEQ
jgi:epoxyqueuosine reductase